MESEGVSSCERGVPRNEDRNAQRPDNLTE